MAKKNTTPNPPVEPSAEVQESEGTTSQLFGAQNPPEPVVEGDIIEGDVVAEPTPVKSVTEPTEKATEYLKIEDFSGQKFKTKIDGVDGEVTIEDLIKGHQTNETIAQRGQELGTQRQALAGERKEFEELKAKVESMVAGGGNVQPTTESQIPTLPADYDMLDETTKNILLNERAQRSQEMAQLNNTIQQLSVGLQPAMIQTEYGVIDKLLKAENTGFDDFMDKVGLVENEILKLPVEQQAEYGSRLGYMNIYKDLKMTEILAANADTSTTPALVPRTEGGTGVPTNADGELSKKSKLFDNAREASRMKDIRDTDTVDPLSKWAQFLDSTG